MSLYYSLNVALLQECKSAVRHEGLVIVWEHVHVMDFNLFH